jgi:hypothetical protein
MRDLFNFELRPNYPHMNFRDKEIWERFILKFPGAYNNVQYDFHVGDAPPFNTLYDDDTDYNQDMLYRLRIDVLGHTDDYTDIIEVKPQAGPSTIGQIEGYKMLYERDEEPKKPIRMVIVTNELKPNMDYLCKAKNILLIVV